jgi:hypothetical protein
MQRATENYFNEYLLNMNGGNEDKADEGEKWLSQRE